MLTQRQAVHRDRKWLAAVHEIEACVLCNTWGIQAAHRDEGKGMGRKTDDATCAAICERCHYELGNGKNLTREQRRAEMDRAIVLTIQQLARRGLIGVK